MHGRHVVLIDSNPSNIAKAKELRLEAITTNIYSDNLGDNIELNDIGYIMALTGSAEINKYAINKYSKQFGENGAFRLLTIDEMKDDGVFPKAGLSSNFDDYNSLTTVTRKYPSIQEIELKDQSHYESLIEITTSDKDIIPLFIKDNKGD